MNIKKLEYIKVADVIDIKDPSNSFREILKRAIERDFKIFVIAELMPGIFEFVPVDSNTIEATFFLEKEHFYSEAFRRYGGEDLDQEDIAIVNGNINTIWIHESDRLRIGRHPKKDESKNSSDQTKIQILEVLVKVLSDEVEGMALSSLLRPEKDKKVLSAISVVDRIRGQASKYFDGATDGELPHGFGERSIQDILSSARKNR